MISEIERQELQARIKQLGDEAARLRVNVIVGNIAKEALESPHKSLVEWSEWTKNWADVIMASVEESRKKALDKVSADEWNRRVHGIEPDAET